MLDAGHIGAGTLSVGLRTGGAGQHGRAGAHGICRRRAACGDGRSETTPCLLEAKRPELAMLDMVLPGVDGLELMRTCR